MLLPFQVQGESIFAKPTNVIDFIDDGVTRLAILQSNLCKEKCQLNDC